MAVAVKQFLTRLTSSGLITEAELRSLLDSVADSAEAAQDLAAALVERYRLTNYQADVLLERREGPLVLGNYVVLDAIGAGGMGQVYKALHRRMERIVALKVLPPSATDSATALRRFHREVRAAAQLDHPNIVTAFDADEADGVHFLVMEYVPGQNFTEMVHRRGRLPVDAAVDCILQVARGLEYAHSRGIIHRDIKPRNLLLKTPREGQSALSGSHALRPTVKVLDMGLALWEPNDPRVAPPTDLTQSGAVMGTVDYMSPEQAVDTHTADARSDVYSLGCTLYYLLTAKPMYGGDTMVKRLLAHRDDPIPALRDVRPDVPERLEQIFRRMVAKSPDDRYPSMTAVIVELEDLQAPTASGAVAAGSQESRTDSLTGLSDDTDLQRFLAAQSQPQTLTYVEAEPRAVEETVVDQSAERTLPSTVSRPSAAKAKIRSRKGLIVALSLLAVATVVVAGVIIKLKTPEGTIVLEFDQADMAGAEVSIDDKHVVTIKTGKGEKPITVAADGKKRLLKVTKAGFETFTKEFSLKKGDRKVITVRLEPLPRQKPKTSPSEDVDRRVARWVLSKSGTLSVQRSQQKKKTLVSASNDLPRDRFRITRINFVETKGLRDDELLQLQQLRSLDNLQLHRTSVTDKGLAHLQKSPIRGLSIQSGIIGDNGVRYLTELRGLKALAIHSPLVTDAALPSISKLTKLTRLSLQARLVSDRGIRHLVTLKELADLDLRFTQVSDAGLRELVKLPALKKLQLARTRITDSGLPILASARQLEFLTLMETKVTAAGVAKLQNALPKCKILWDGNYDGDRAVAGWVLSIGGNVVLRLGGGQRVHVTQRSPRLPQQMFHFVEVHLGWNAKVTDDDLNRVHGLAQLERLQLGNTSISDAGVRQLRDLPALQSVDLAYTNVGDQSLRHLATFPKLTAIQMFGNPRTTNKGLEALKDCKQLTLLKVSGRGITDEGLEHLRGLTKLETLWITNSRITSRGLKVLKQMPDLKEACFMSTRSIGDAELEQIAACSQLTTLRLDSTGITDQGMNSLAHLANLRIGVIRSTSVSDVGLERLSRLRNLEQLDARGSKVTAAGVAKLQKALPKCRFVWDGNSAKPTNNDERTRSAQKRD